MVFFFSREIYPRISLLGLDAVSVVFFSLPILATQFDRRRSLTFTRLSSCFAWLDLRATSLLPPLAVG